MGTRPCPTSGCCFTRSEPGSAQWRGRLIAGSRVRYRKGLHWFTFALRLAIAVSMFGYGLAKLSGAQFSSPADFRLFQSYGNSSPMGLLWTFMGHSQVYSSFTGLAEILGGVLLLSRRTAKKSKNAEPGLDAMWSSWVAHPRASRRTPRRSAPWMTRSTAL